MLLKKFYLPIGILMKKTITFTTLLFFGLGVFSVIFGSHIPVAEGVFHGWRAPDEYCIEALGTYYEAEEDAVETCKDVGLIGSMYGVDSDAYQEVQRECDNAWVAVATAKDYARTGACLGMNHPW